METPNVKSVVVDEERGVRYELMAYRRLTEQELVGVVRMYLSQRKRKKPKKGDIITIVSIIGCNE